MRIHERREELLRAVDRLQKEQFEKNIRSLEEAYREDECRREAVKAFSKLALRWQECSGSKKKAACLGICYLYSGILRRDFGFRLILMGEEFWLEEEPMEEVWKPADFFERFEEDVEAVIRKLRDKFIRLCRAEEDAVRFWCAEYYLAAACRLCVDMAEEIATSMELEKMDRTDGFYFFFGHYQGKGEIIWQEKKENLGDV